MTSYNTRITCLWLAYFGIDLVTNEASQRARSPCQRAEMSLAASACRKSTRDETFPVQVRLQPRRQSYCTSYYYSMRTTKSEQNHTWEHWKNQSSLLSASSVLISYFPKVSFFPYKEDQDRIFLWAVSFFRLEGVREKKNYWHPAASCSPLHSLGTIRIPAKIQPIAQCVPIFFSWYTLRGRPAPVSFYLCRKQQQLIDQRRNFLQVQFGEHPKDLFHHKLQLLSR